MDELPFRVHWKLGELLERERVSVYRLEQELSKRVARSTLYRWAREHTAPERPDLVALGWVLWGLERITAKRYRVEDIIEFSAVNNADDNNRQGRA
jgi:hypothetical protein